MSIYTHAPITWSNDTINNLNTFNQEIKEKMTDIDTANTAEIAARDSQDAAVMRAIYPIGCIYTTVVATNPATVFGFGTWVAFGAGKVLVGLNAAETEFDVVEETGGEKTHTLLTAEMPAHTHTGANVSVGNFIGGGGGDNTITWDRASGSTGGGGAHQNLQPYIVVYFFKRTA